MPGIVVFQRRWSVGSDDLVVPGITLSFIHSVWLIVVVVSLGLDAVAQSKGLGVGTTSTDLNNVSTAVPTSTTSTTLMMTTTPVVVVILPQDYEYADDYNETTLVDNVTTTALPPPPSLMDVTVVEPTPTPVAGNDSSETPFIDAFVSDDDGNGADVSSCTAGVLQLLLLLHTVLLLLSLILEVAMARLALQGTMWDVQPRRLMEYVLYCRLFVLVMEVVWSSYCIVWLHAHYFSATCQQTGLAKQILLGSVICEMCVALSVVITIWCTFDRAGRSWVKMERFQRSMKDGETKYHYKRSGSHRPNWRQRKVMRTYQDTWNHRCKILFCCMGRSDQYQDSFSEIARLLTDFFRDLDLVPTDIVAGLVLLRKQQKKLQQTLVTQDPNDIYEFLSGVPVTSRTRFLTLSDPEQLEQFQSTAYFMKFALAAYGWPMYLLGHSKTGLCRLTPHIRCCCCMGGGGGEGGAEPWSQPAVPVVVGDTCSGCHLAALKQSIGSDGDYQVIFASFHVDVAETPFFVAVDYRHQSVVVSIRGTISMKDVITDLHAEAEPIPLQLPRDDWFGHKGMVQTATYIRNKLEKENLLGQAFSFNPERGTADFRLVLVGHSLGAGTAAILALLLRHEYPNVHCYAYSPPGGLLSLPAAEFTKGFVTSVVVGKDVVPRLGLHQLETLRTSLMTAIKKSTQPKWKILGSSMMCCGRSNRRIRETGSTSPAVSVEDGATVTAASAGSAKDLPLTKHPSDTNISLSTHQPLYPPGSIIHIVRQHMKPSSERDGTAGKFESTDPIYQAVWADTVDFNEVLISPVMVHDHMPDTVLRALNKVLSSNGPSKPQRVTVSETVSPVEMTPLPTQSERVQYLHATVSLPSIDRSPILGHRFFNDEQHQRMTRINSDILPIFSGTDTTNQLLAPMASPETLSDDSSMAGSRASLALIRRARRLWRRESIKASTVMATGHGRAHSSGSDVFDMTTESSSVYCASPLSSVRRVSTVASRSQLKREIMRLYQRAAADVGDHIERQQNKTSSSSYSTSSMAAGSHSRSTSNSSASQPRMITLDHMSPVFGVASAGGSMSSETTSRPATANGAGRRLSPSAQQQQQQQQHRISPLLPPCNTSF